MLARRLVVCLLAGLCLGATFFRANDLAIEGDALLARRFVWYLLIDGFLRTTVVYSYLFSNEEHTKTNLTAAFSEKLFDSLQCQVVHQRDRQIESAQLLLQGVEFPILLLHNKTLFDSLQR